MLFSAYFEGSDEFKKKKKWILDKRRRFLLLNKRVIFNELIAPPYLRFIDGNKFSL